MECWECRETRARSQPPFWREKLFLGGYLEAVQRNLPCHTFKLLSLQWHSDRSLPVWYRGRESFRLPLPVADANRRAGHLPSRGLAPPNCTGCSGQSQPPTGAALEAGSPHCVGSSPQSTDSWHSNTLSQPPSIPLPQTSSLLTPHMVISSLHTPPIPMQNNHVNPQLL